MLIACLVHRHAVVFVGDERGSVGVLGQSKEIGCCEDGVRAAEGGEEGGGGVEVGGDDFRAERAQIGGGLGGRVTG